MLSEFHKWLNRIFFWNTQKEEEDSNGKCPRSVNRWRFSASTRISPVVGVLCINDAGNTWSMMAQGDGGISLISNQHDFPFLLLQIYIYRLDFLTLLFIFNLGIGKGHEQSCVRDPGTTFSLVLVKFSVIVSNFFFPWTGRPQRENKPTFSCKKKLIYTIGNK